MAVKLLPLEIKKTLSRRLRWFDLGSAVVLGAAAMMGGLGGTIWSDSAGGPGEAGEKIVLEEKVTHLLKSYEISQSIHNLALVAAAQPDIVVSPQLALEKDKSARAAFEAEEQATGIALAHARQLSPHDRTALYDELAEIKPRPDYFMPPSGGRNSPMTAFRGAQAKVMNRPGFTPSLATAREIVAGSADGELVVFKWMLGPPVASLAGAFLFCAGRKRLDRSIKDDETEISNAAEEAKQADAARQAADAAERERIAKLPAETTLGRDISVRQIKLAGKEKTPGL